MAINVAFGLFVATVIHFVDSIVLMLRSSYTNVPDRYQHEPGRHKDSVRSTYSVRMVRYP